MPDLKFDGSFYFSANTPSKGNPLLVPVITNPTFASTNTIPGILELINGDIGITEKLLSPIVTPIVKAMTSNPLLVKNIANANGISSDENTVVQFLTNQLIPKNSGFKPLEKTIITTMMESYKPVLDFLKILLETLGVAEDIVCRTLGTSIKVSGQKIGLDSRSPYYWDASLGYTETLTFAMKQAMESVQKATDIMNSSISDSNPIKNSTPSITKNSVSGNTDLPAYYIGYFDKSGNSIPPPKWVIDSNKWFKLQNNDINTNIVSIGSPFPQLSDDLNIGIPTLRTMLINSIESIQTSKNNMIQAINQNIATANTLTNADDKKIAISSLEAQLKQASSVLDDLSQSILDVIDGTNISGGNYIDDSNTSLGINSPATINEWVAKTRGSQFRAKYYPTQISTAQNLVGYNSKAKAPYVFIPKIGVNYKGLIYDIEVPMAFSNQIGTNKVYSNSLFYSNKEIQIDGKGIKTFSNQNIIKSLDINPNNLKTPFIENSKTHFSNDISNEYIPDIIKRYYLPLQWQEVLEYELIEEGSGKILGTENQFVNFKIDVENDYELRLIKVINKPLIPIGGNNNINKIYPELDVVIFTKNSYLQFIQMDTTPMNYNINILSNNTFNTGRYSDINFFIENSYFLLRKDNVWINNFIDSDDSEIYQIANINYTWITSNLINTNIIIDNSLKTITLNSIIPNYITEYNGTNFFIDSQQNPNTYLIITDIENSNNTITLKYIGELFNETISSDITIKYLDSISISINQEFNAGTNFSASLYNVKNLNYIPKNISQGIKSMLLHGLDLNIYNSIINNNLTNIISTPNTTLDLLVNILDIENVLSNKGINIMSVKLNINIPQQFNFKYYSSNKDSNFYYPLEIYTTPLTNNDTTSSSTSGTGMIYDYGNTIPDIMDLTNPNSTNHSTPDINEQNLLKEGIIYQGLDVRYQDYITHDYFYLIEAIKKNNNGIAPINNKLNPIEVINTSNKKASVAGGGKEWYGLLDKFEAIPEVIDKLVPYITSMIPLLVKLIQTIENPSQMSALLLSIALTDESISKFPVNFPDFSKNGFLGKEESLSNQPVPKTINDAQILQSKSDSNKNLYYNGIQPTVKNPKPIFMLDGQALAEFGKGAFGKSIFSFGVELKNGVITPIKTLKKNPDSNSAPLVREQSLFNSILNFVKLPFETIFKIFTWVLKWVKKLLNPAKIASALEELLSFKWLSDILGKDSIMGIMGLVDISATQSKINELVDGVSNPKAQELLNDVLKSIRGNNLNFVEVYIYDVLINGIKVGEKIVETPFNNGDLTTQNVKNSNGGDASLNAVNDAQNSSNATNPCSNGIFSLTDLLPIPLFNSDVKFSDCELPILFLKPLQQMEALLKMLQEFLNGFLSIPISILGLEPTIEIPKFGKEIPFANIITDLISKLETSIPQLKQF